MRLPALLPIVALVLVGCHDDQKAPWPSACAPSCAAGEVCWAGGCLPGAACAAPFTACAYDDDSLGCTDLRDDPFNCGGCGLRCLAGSCLNGICRSGDKPCAEAGLSECTDADGNRYCAYLPGDDLDCGACGNACDFGAGERCAAGACQPAGTTCESLALTACPLGCSDLVTDPYNCGQCGNVCLFGCDGLGACR